MPCSESHSSAEESLTTLCSQGGAQPPRSGNSPAPQGHKKTLYVKTYGCQMNVYDSTRMQDVMALEGYAPIATAEGADVVILNTCHIREKAEEKVYSDLGRLRALKHAVGGKMLIAVGGCVGQAEGEEIFRRAPYVDMVFGPQSYHLLPEMVAKAARGENRTMALDFAPEPKFDALPVPAHNAVSAFLSVQEGCDKFCTFCVVPYTRGAEYSRPVSAILREAEALAGAGAQEITLLGQNVNAWHGQGEGGEWGLGRLLRALAGIPGLARLRYTTSHPRDMDDDLIHAHGELETLMPFLHLPVQSGSDRILARMNRKHTVSEYLTIIEKLRSRRPDMAFSSDIIVGFPGETELDFAATLRLVETVGFAQCYSFAYSSRPGTPAASDAAQLPGAVKDERLRTLQALIMRQQLAFNQSVVGRTLPVLFDRLGKRPGQWLGKTPYMQSVYLDAPEKALPRRILPITVREAYQNSVTGVLADSLPVPRRNLASESCIIAVSHHP